MYIEQYLSFHKNEHNENKAHHNFFLKQFLNYPIFFVSQINSGFRKSRILNEAIRHCRSQYLILLDGDCVPHPNFVRGHLDNRETGYYLAGRRIDLEEDISQSFKCNGGDISKFLSKRFWKVGKINRLFPIRSKILRQMFKQDKVMDMMGCNASFFKNDFLAVDGFDESFEGYFREDGDLEMRFRHIGLKIKSVKGISLIYHLWHPRRTDINDNEKLFQDTIDTKRVKAIKGFSAR